MSILDKAKAAAERARGQARHGAEQGRARLPIFAGPWDPIADACPDLQSLQRTYLFAVVLRQAGALPQQDAAAATGILASASPDAVVHNPFTNHEGPLCLAVLDLAAH